MSVKKNLSIYFFIFFYLNIFCKGIGLDGNSRIYLFLIIIGFVPLLIKIVFTKYYLHELIVIVSVSIIGILSYIVSKKPTLMLTCFTLAGLKGINIDKLMKGTFFIRLFTFISVISLSLLEVIENKSITMWRNDQLDVRYSLGYGHPNLLHLSFFILVATYMYIYFDKLNLRQYLIIFVTNIILYEYSGSRTGFIGVALSIFFFYLAKSDFIFIKKLICKSLPYVFIILVFVSFALARFYGKAPITISMDNFLNGRLFYSNYYLTNYGFSIFGNKLNEATTFFDNGYLLLYIQYGIAGIGLIGSLIYMVCLHLRKTEDFRKSALVLVFLIYIFTESFSPNIFMNVILLFASPVIYSYRS